MSSVHSMEAGLVETSPNIRLIESKVTLGMNITIAPNKRHEVMLH